MQQNITVTGAFGTLGRAVVERLNVGGARVAAIDLVNHAERDLLDGVRLFGGVDLADPASVDRCFSEIASDQPITGLVNVAGGFVWQLMTGGNIDDWDRMYRMNLRSAAVACSSIVPFLAPNASIITIGAAAAVNRPGAGMAPYAASKAGVIALTESLAEELRGRARVNAILPSIIDTPANRADMPDADPSQWVTPKELADVVAFLLSDAANCISGATIRTR